MEIIEAYDRYQPPPQTREDLARLVAALPTEMLAGLGSVRLTNRDALRSRSRRWTWSRGKKSALTDAAGLYHHRGRSGPACIEIFVDQVFTGMPRWAARVRLLRELALGRVFYHELGHHLHATNRPEYRDREAVADAWSARLTRSYVRSNHPWLSRLLAPIVRTWRILSKRGVRRRSLRG